jgi:hypothetical protein
MSSSSSSVQLSHPHQPTHLGNNGAKIHQRLAKLINLHGLPGSEQAAYTTAPSFNIDLVHVSAVSIRELKAALSRSRIQTDGSHMRLGNNVAPGSHIDSCPDSRVAEKHAHEIIHLNNNCQLASTLPP